MSSAIIVGLIVVLWLFVLAPLVLKNYKPIRRTNEALEETRVVVEGGAETPTRKRPRLTYPESTQEGQVDEQPVEDDTEDVILVDDAPSRFVGEKIGGVFAAAQEKLRIPRSPGIEPDLIEDEEPEYLTPAYSELAYAEPDYASAEYAESPEDGFLEGDFPEDDYADAEYIDSSDAGQAAYSYDDSYLAPADMLDPDADYCFADEVLPEEEYDEPCEEEESEEDRDNLTPEDLAFAARRRGRGGYDPEVDAAIAMTRYHRRQRTLMTLVLLVLVSIAPGVIFGGLYWLATVASVSLAVLYMYALRQQVRAEQELRNRRIRQMRRARLGVRNASDEELGIPARLRRPGAIVLEVDDDSPDFHELDYVYTEFQHTDHDDRSDDYLEPRRVG